MNELLQIMQRVYTHTCFTNHMSSYYVAMTDETYKDHFLIAMPILKDSTFSKSVIYLYEHTEDGAMGLVINKPLQITLGNVLRHLEIQVNCEAIENEPVMMGGPVGQEHGFVIHETLEDEADEDGQIVISASKEILRSIAKGKGPDHYLVTLGYSGWEAGQLEQEITRNDWLLAPYDPDIIFKTPIDKRWEAAAQLIGVDIKHLSDQIGHA